MSVGGAKHLREVLAVPCGVTHPDCSGYGVVKGFCTRLRKKVWMCKDLAEDAVSCSICERLTTHHYELGEHKYCGKCCGDDFDEFISAAIDKDPCLLFTYFGFKPDYLSDTPSILCERCDTEHPERPNEICVDSFVTPDGSFVYITPISRKAAVAVSEFLTPQYPELCKLIEDAHEFMTTKHVEKMARREQTKATARMVYQKASAVVRAHLDGINDSEIVEILKAKKHRGGLVKVSRLEERNFAEFMRRFIECDCECADDDDDKDRGDNPRSCPIVL